MCTRATRPSLVLHDDLVLRQRSGDDTKIRSVQHVTGAQLAEQLAAELVSLLSLGAHVSERLGESVVAQPGHRGEPTANRTLMPLMVEATDSTRVAPVDASADRQPLADGELANAKEVDGCGVVAGDLGSVWPHDDYVDIGGGITDAEHPSTTARVPSRSASMPPLVRSATNTVASPRRWLVHRRRRCATQRPARRRHRSTCAVNSQDAVLRTAATGARRIERPDLPRCVRLTEPGRTRGPAGVSSAGCGAGSWSVGLRPRRSGWCRGGRVGTGAHGGWSTRRRRARPSGSAKR